VRRKSIVGRSAYDDRTIYVEYNTPYQMMLTLKHELMHVWLYEHGHTNQDGKEVFGYEDVCELTALSNDFINKIVKKYTLRSS
jgi:Zn-dependent peptidase ImmA (M78 family)